MAKKYTSKFTGQEIDNILTKAQESASDIQSINEKLKGKTNTFVLTTTRTITQLKSWLNANNDIIVKDANGNDITEAVKNGDYDNYNYANSLFYSNDNSILGLDDYRSFYIIIIKAVKANYPAGVHAPFAEQHIIDKITNVFEIGDTVLVTETDVPDRWYAGRHPGFYALESRTYKMGATNLENGTGTNAIQMKQDGDSGVFDFTGKNPNATAFDNDLTGEIPYGAAGNFATVVGGKAYAQGKRSMAQGTTTIAIGNYSHAEGDNSVAYGNDSHAEGYATLTIGTASHAEGNNTAAVGEISHAEGFSTEAIGQGSHAEGAHTIAKGDYSHAEGLRTETNYDGQTVVGHYNDNKETTVFEVGNGESDTNRKNAFEVYLDGHAEVQTAGTTDKSVVRRADLNNLDNVRITNSDKTISTLIKQDSGSLVLTTNGWNSTAQEWNGTYPFAAFTIKDRDGSEDSTYPSGYLSIEVGPAKGKSGINNLITLNAGVSSIGFNKSYYALPSNVGTKTEPAIIATQEYVDNNLPNYTSFSTATNLQNGREKTKSVQGGKDSVANYDGDFVFGTGLETTTENQAAFGVYNTVDWDYTNGRPLLTIGNGLDADNRHTAFEVYNNNSIKVGDTIITEDQLKALLALLNN